MQCRYAHSLAGQTSFLDSKESIESAIESLSRVVECQATFSIALDDIREMKFLAADQIQKLNAYLRSTFFITTTVYL